MQMIRKLLTLFGRSNLLILRRLKLIFEMVFNAGRRKQGILKLIDSHSETNSVRNKLLSSKHVCNEYCSKNEAFSLLFKMTIKPFYLS